MSWKMQGDNDNVLEPHSPHSRSSLELAEARQLDLPASLLCHSLTLPTTIWARVPYPLQRRQSDGGRPRPRHGHRHGYRVGRWMEMDRCGRAGVGVLRVREVWECRRGVPRGRASVDGRHAKRDAEGVRKVVRSCNIV